MFKIKINFTGEQTKGACLVPKRALKVMDGEVNRLLQLTSNSMIPITYQVPRKTYRDFHADLFPDTVGDKSELTPQEWFDGQNISVPLISLDPAKQELGISELVVSIFCYVGSKKYILSFIQIKNLYIMNRR